MNQKNLSFLKDNLKYLGFGEQLYPQLEKNVQQGFPEFILHLDKLINEHAFSASLYFKKGQQGDIYFFHHWQGTLKREQESREQIFFCASGTGHYPQRGV